MPLPKRRQFLRHSATLAAASIGALVAPSLTAQSNTSNAKKRRIVMVTWRGQTDAERGFMDYWKSQTNAPEIIWQDAAQNSARLNDIANDIVRMPPDLIYAWGTPVSLGLAGTVAKPHPVIGDKIPLVFAIVADPVAADITTALTGHGRNISGVSHVAPLSAQMEAMRAYRPIRSVGIIYNPLEPNALANVAAWQALGKKYDFRIASEAFPVTNGKLDASETKKNIEMVARLAGEGVNWLYLGPDSHLFTQLPSIAAAATERNLLTFAAVESMLNSPAPVLTGLVSKFYQVGQFAAFKAEQMLKGERNVPIETLKRFSLVVRLDTAKQINAYPPLRLIDYAEFRGVVAKT